MTRDRFTYLVVVLLLVCGGIWVARHTYWDDTVIPLAPQGEAATNPYYSVQHLATALGIRSSFVVSLSAAPPKTGALLIDGFQGDMTHAHVDELGPWVEAGGRLIITDDVVRAAPKFQTWSDIHLGTHYDTASKSKTQITPPTPEDDCAPLVLATDSNPATGNPGTRRLTLCAPRRESGWVTKRTLDWALSNRFGVQVLRVSIGRGSVTLIPRYFLIDNKNLLKADHAEIFIAASNLTRGDALHIVNVAQAETLLALIWRLAAPAVVFFGLAALCIILRELPRFGPPVPPPAMVRRSLAEQIRGNAAFAWRTRRLTALRAAVRRALDAAAGKRIVAYSGMDVRTRADAIAAWAGADAEALSSAMAQDAAAAPHVQRAAISLLERTRRILETRIQREQGPV